MQIISIKQQKPIYGEWYIVKCPNYSQSGFEIACWQDSYWENQKEELDDSFIVGYCPIPLSNLL